MADKLGNENTSWVEKVFFFFFLFLFSVRMIIADQDTVIGHSHKLEVDKLLKKLNKPAAKSIKCASVFIKGNKYYGGKGAMNVWNPNVEQSQEYSLSATWVGSDADRENIEVIEAGWQSDSSKNTGCYDLLCSGFVQVYSAVALGSSIMPLSLYNDTNSQYQITITIWKDKGDGDWWMRYGTDQIVGYWPSSLFSSLSDSATVIEWGGEVGNSGTNGQHTTTQMGSGHFAGKS
ncbi:uncharacterized protein LOC114734416 [Neltuma alba]|uniref:uncharacterized protein LOC114734416 n=1 Tax=Neltuma alba TaxID=207710 RepID=UPI0010A45F56|nr:uncharacterized protein LOC114734416 [Prosopis alba]